MILITLGSTMALTKTGPNTIQYMCIYLQNMVYLVFFVIKNLFEYILGPENNRGAR
jgi:hypothetical protein